MARPRTCSQHLSTHSRRIRGTRTAALSQALADCVGTTLNQVCYAGSVTLDGGGSLTTPYRVATLDGVSGLTLVSPDAGHWSVALLRLAADSPTPDLGLTLLAFGNVEIRNLAQFDAAAGNGDGAPALSFSSSPVPGEEPETGGPHRLQSHPRRAAVHQPQRG